MRIEEYQDVYENAWDAYCERHSQGTFFHKIGWKQLIERVYGYKPIYLMAINNDDIIGVLPLFYVQHWALGKKLISFHLPFMEGSAPIPLKPVICSWIMPSIFLKD